jgi:alpha-L-rhamnosidase
MNKEKLVLDGLLKAIANTNKDGHIDAGVVGTKAILNVLMDFGQSEIIYSMANKRTFPGWGYWVDELHANTMFQNWDGSQSRNHIMFGTIGDYFFKGLGGIQPLEAYPGFERFLIQPLTDNDLEWVEAGHDSPYGMISSHWRKDATGLSVELRVPANSRAELRLPVKGKPAVIQGHPVSFERISDENAGDFYRADLPAGEYLIRQNKE